MELRTEMKKVIKHSIFFLIILALNACNDSPFFNPYAGSNSLNTIRIPDNFNWSLSAKVDLTVAMKAQGQVLESIEGEQILLLDTLQNVLTRAIIHDQETRLYCKIPANLGQMIVYFPATGNFEYIYSWACLGTLYFDYAWDNPEVENQLQYLELSNENINSGALKSGTGLKASVFGNSDFSQNSLTEVSSFTDNLNTNGQWYVTTGNKAPATIENEMLLIGQQKNRTVEVFQTVNWTEGGEFEVIVPVRSTDKKDVNIELFLFFYSRNGDLLRQKNKKYKVKKPENWEEINVQEEVPDNTYYIKFMIQDEGKSDKPFEIDNISSTYNSDPDTDKDGVLDREDDFPNDPLRAYNDFFPSEDDFGTLAFEDLWPAKGDYDFNDLVVDYRFNQVRNSENLIVEILATISLRAIGGSFHNGFGFELPFSKTLIDGIDGQELQEGIVNLESNGTETGSENATVIVFEDAWNYIRVTGVSFVNTYSDAAQAEPYVFNLQIRFTEGLTDEEAGSPPYNPFIFINGDRSREVHLYGNQPTDLMNLELFGTGDDYSNTGSAAYFKTASNLPWALDIPASFDYPEEKNPVNEAYLNFIEWAETAGSSRNDWYQEKDGYRVPDKIFRRK